LPPPSSPGAPLLVPELAPLLLPLPVDPLVPPEELVPPDEPDVPEELALPEELLAPDEVLAPDEEPDEVALPPSTPLLSALAHPAAIKATQKNRQYLVSIIFRSRCKPRASPAAA
jgi:hypothetical protein